VETVLSGPALQKYYSGLKREGIKAGKKLLKLTE
jgi:hypothetical protein